MFSLARMGVILEINRDFPFQVALSFDEAAMEVLNWLEDCPFEWDVYVDLPANSVRTAFAPSRTPRRSSSVSDMRRKGELSPASIDSGWPHQIALPARFCERGGYEEIHEFCKNLSLCSRGHAVFHNGQWFNIYCFAEAADAEKFMTQFGGEKFDPSQRGRGSNWAKWNKA